MNLSRLLRTTLFAALGLLLVGAFMPAQAQTTFFVDAEDGSDADAGDSDDPFETISRALTAASDGDEIRVRGDQGYTAVHESGSGSATLRVSNDNLTIVAVEDPSSNENEVLVGSGVTFDVAPSNSLSLGESGDGFFTFDGTFEISSGDLTTGPSNVNIADGGEVIRDGGGPVEGGFTYNGSAVLDYQASVTTGDELPSSFDAVELTSTSGSPTVTFGGDANVQQFTNTNGGTFDLEGNTLTLTNNSGGTVTHDNDNEVEDGTVVFEGSNQHTIAQGNGTFPDVTFNGTVEFDDGAGNTHSFGDFVMNSGSTVTLGDGGSALTIDFGGNFTRNGGTLNEDNSTLQASGSQDTNFSPGQNLTINTLNVSKSSNATLTVNNSFDLTGDLTVGGSSVIALGSFDARLKGTGSVSTLDGQMQSTTGAVQFKTPGSSGQIAGGGTYTNIEVVLSNATDNVNVTSDIDFSGTLDLSVGGINADASGGQDISPKENALVIRDLSGGNQQIVAGGGGTFNGDNNTYDLQTNGSTSGSPPVLGNEFENGSGVNIRNLTISTTGAGARLPNTAFTLTGDLTVDANANLGVRANNITVEEALTVRSGGTIGDIGNDISIVLTGDGFTHEIAGVVDQNGVTGGIITLDVDNNATINGSTVASDASAVTNLDLGDGSNALSIDINNLQQVANTVTVTAGGPSVDLGLFDGGNAGEGEIGGQVAVNSGALNFTSNVTSTVSNSSAIDVDGSATLSYGSNNVNLFGGSDTDTGLDVNGDASISGSGTVTLADESGDTPTLDLNGNGVENLTLDAETTLGSNAEVSSLLDQNDDITGGSDLTLSGDAVINDPDGGRTFNAGTFIVAGSEVEGETNVNFDDLEVNTSGTATFATNDTDNPRVFEVESSFTHTEGDLSIGVNDIELQDASFSSGNDAGSISANGGFLVVDDRGSGGNNFVGFDTGNNTVSVPNFRLERTVGGNNNTQDSNDGYRLTQDDELEVTNELELLGGVLDASTNSGAVVTIGDGVLITRDQGQLDQAPNFGNNISVTYDGAVNTDEELPSTVVDLTANAGVTFDKDVTVTNSFDHNTSSTINSTVTVNDGAEVAVGADFSGGSGSINYPGAVTLRYDGASNVNSASNFSEFQTGTTTDVIVESGVNLNDDGLTARSFDFQTSGGGDFDVADGGDQTFTVTGDVTQASGAGFFENEDNDNTGTVVLGGSSQQTLTLNGDGEFVAVDNDPDDDEVLNLELDNSSGAVISGGNLIMDAATGSDEGVTNLVLTEGNLSTGSNYVQLDHENTSTQGFERPSGGGTVLGNVRKEIPSAGSNANTLEFPTGKDGSSIHRPISITFNEPGEVSTADIYLEANHQPANPQGSNGIDELSTTDSDGDALDVDRYPDFYWDVEATSTLSPSVEYDVELDARQAPEFEDEDIERVRIINRADGQITNRWDLNGDGPADYNNRQPASDRAIAVVRNSTGGLVNDPGQFFTFGLENNLEAAQIADKDIDAGATETGPDLGTSVTDGGVFTGGTGEYSYSGTVQDEAGNDVTLGVSSSDDNVATGSVNNSDELVVNGVNGGTATLTVTMADQLGIIQTQTVDVNVNAGVVFTDGGTLDNQTVFEVGGVNNDPFTFTFEAEDQDPGESLSDATDPFELVNNPDNVSIDPNTGELTFEPSFAQAQSTSPVTIEVQVTDNDGRTDETTAELDVEFDRVLGDVNGSGFEDGSGSNTDLSGISSGDALAALEVAVGKETFEFGGLAGETVGDRFIRAADCAPLEDQSDASQGCGGDSPLQANRSDVNSGDALAILQVSNATDGGSPNVASNRAKSAGTAEEASGALEIQDPKVKGNTATLPVVLSGDAANVRAADLTLDLSKLDAEVQSVTNSLPDGWMTAQNVSGDELKVGMIGQRAPKSGKVAEIKLNLSGESLPTLEGQYRLNGSDAQDLEVQVAPSEFELKGNYPNPVSRSTTIEYQMSEEAPVTIEVYNTLGQKVATLVDETKKAGRHEVNLDAGSNGLSSGVYIYRLSAGDFTASKRMTVVR